MSTQQIRATCTEHRCKHRPDSALTPQIRDTFIRNEGGRMHVDFRLDTTTTTVSRTVQAAERSSVWSQAQTAQNFLPIRWRLAQ